MSKRVITLIYLFLCLAGVNLQGQYYGMQFAAHEYSLDQRSGLDLTPDRPVSLKENLELGFNLRFVPDQESYFGYVFRIIIGDKTIDLIHGDIEGNPNNFELIIDRKTSKIAFPIPMEALMQDWTMFKFVMDFENEKINCTVNGIVINDLLEGFDCKEGIRLMYGAHPRSKFPSTDVPSMIIRDVELKVDGNDKYSWPLNETEGNIAHSTPRGSNGIATNPTWLLKQHNTWKNILEMEISGAAKIAFDSQNGDLYILSKDSVYTYNVVSNTIKAVPQPEPASVDVTNSLIFNPVSSTLTRYSLDNHYITSFNFESRQWSPYEAGEELETTYWHHSQVLSPDGYIVAFGGYGYFRYKNSLLKWNPDRLHFDSINYKGLFLPRYLAGAAYNSLDSMYYVIGGYGSESGKQTESPDYHYEILRYSPREQKFSTLHKFEDVQAGFCIAHSIVFDEKNNLYALYFPKYDFNNKLQLIQVPLDKPEIITLGDPIEYLFLDVDSHADLYYSKRNKTLVAVSTYTSDNQTSISAHTIAFPPQKYLQAEEDTMETKMRLLPFLVAGLILLFSGIVFYISRRRRKKKSPAKKLTETSRQSSTTVNRKNTIILFGGFQVFDRDGKDITGQFTPLPKKLFLFILLHSLRNNKGVSSAVLYETFWFDKSVESARNNRAVNIVKLKSLLDNLDSAGISKDTGYWKFDFDPSQVSIDYHDYLSIVRQKSDLSHDDIVALLSCIENKAFLSNTQADWLDSFKSEISNEIIDTLLHYISTSKDDAEFLLHITSCIFLFDAVSEEALKIQCRLLIKQGKHSLAKNSYSRFTKEYRQLYDEDYGLSFNQLIDEKTPPNNL